MIDTLTLGQSRNSFIYDRYFGLTAYAWTTVYSRDYAPQVLYGSFRKFGVPYFGVLIIRILLFGGATLGSPIFGNPQIGTRTLK